MLEKSEDVVFRRIKYEYILVQIVASATDMEWIFNLNETDAMVWEKLDGKKPLTRIIAEIQAEYDVDDEQLERDVVSLVDEMREASEEPFLCGVQP